MLGTLPPNILLLLHITTNKEEEDEDKRQRRVSLADALHLVPLICTENGAPCRNWRSFCVTRGFTGIDKLATWFLPVHQEYVNVTL